MKVCYGHMPMHFVPRNAILGTLLYGGFNQTLFRPSVYKNPAVYLSGAKNVFARCVILVS